MSLAKGLSFYMNGVSLGCALQSYDATSETESLDTTTLCRNSRTYSPGFKTGTVSASGIWDYDSTNLDEIHDVFSSAYNNGSTARVIATLETLAVGANAVIFDAMQTSYNVEVPNGALIMCNADFQVDGGIGYGKILFNAGVTGTTPVNGTGVDFTTATATTNGGLFIVEVQNPSQVASGSIKLQTSSNNSTWTDVQTLNLTTAKFEALSYHVPSSVSLQRYNRVVCTGNTGGTITFVAGFARR